MVINKKNRFITIFTGLIFLVIVNLFKFDVAEAYRSKYVKIDGIEFELRNTSVLAEDGKEKKLAEIQEFKENCVDFAVDGVLTIPAKIEYEGESYIVTDIPAVLDMPEEIHEVIIPETFGSYIDKISYIVGLINVEKLTILSDKVILTPQTSEDSIDYWEFKEEVSRLKTIEIKSKDVIMLSEFLDRCTNLENIIFEPDARVELRRGAITNCPKLKTLVLPSGTIYNEGAIIGCNIDEIKFASPSPRYGISDGCIITRKTKKLLYVPPNTKTFTVPNRITAIGQFAFANCENLTEVTARGKNLKKINKYAFYNRNLLTKVTLGKSLERIEDYAFQGCNLKELYLSDSLKKIGHGIVFENPNLKKLTLDPKSKHFKMESGMILTKSGHTVKIAFGKPLLEIPKGVRVVDGDCIINPELVQELRYPSTLKRIYTNDGTKNLEKIIFKAKVPPEVPDENKDYRRISYVSYYNLASLKSIEIFVPKGTKNEYRDLTNFASIAPGTIIESK